MDWEEVVEPLAKVHGLWVGFFILYVAFVYFAVLNVVTGVFCQTAIESAAKDQEEILQMQNSAKEDYVNQLTALFNDVDVDGSGELTIDEFENLLNDERLQKYCASLDITLDDAWALFKLLDANESGSISAEEFVTGCLRLQGSARSVDMALLSYQMNWMITRFTKFVAYSDEQFQGLRLFSSLEVALMKRYPDDFEEFGNRKPSLQTDTTVNSCGEGDKGTSASNLSREDGGSTEAPDVILLHKAVQEDSNCPRVKVRGRAERYASKAGLPSRQDSLGPWAPHLWSSEARCDRVQPCSSAAVQKQRHPVGGNQQQAIQATCSTGGAAAKSHTER